MAANVKKMPSPIRRRLDEALAAIGKMEDQGHAVSGMTLTPKGAVIYLKPSNATNRMIGSLRRITGPRHEFMEMEMIVDRVRVRWMRHWPVNTARRTH